MSDAEDSFYFDRYGDLELQRRMVGDRARTKAFADAIREVVRDGDFVLDVGCGTGVLAMLAARAGARRVVAIDQSGVVQAAANLVRHNGLEDRVEILRGSMAELELGEPADVLVSEWLGNFALVEDMWADVAAVRDRCLRDGGRMMPEAVQLFLAPVDDAVAYFGDGPGLWREPVEGLDFAPLESLELRQGRSVQTRIDASTLLGPPVCIASLDARTDGPRAGQGESAHTLDIARDGQLVGLVGWFEAQLSPSVRLSTAPWELETHWSQTFLPLGPQLVRAGDAFELAVGVKTHPEERRHLQMEIALGDRELSFRLE
jgi:SAM-dependent methyltransferase